MQMIVKLYRRISTSYVHASWEERWELKFNATKCNILRATTHARRKIITKNYKLNGVIILAETSSTTYLGRGATLGQLDQGGLQMSRQPRLMGQFLKKLKLLPSGVSRISFRGGVQNFFCKVGVFAWREAPCSAWRSHAFARGVRGHAPPRKF